MSPDAEKPDDTAEPEDQTKALADHMATLQHAEAALVGALVQIREIRVDYAKAEEQRQRQSRRVKT